ncbi:unnamed protein product [Linum tenue]|uniref:Agenet domain-containing protein n=1 Tax=Linum tenue TaxID=586396 RepID=A0AAV0IR98_9ROSI|nr:unnamed protein product [Linum tenue]
MLSISCLEFMSSRSSPGTMRFRGSWYAGTVVRREAKNTNRYVVEYDQLYADESGEKLLQETLDWVQLCPPPPPPEKKVQFKFEDEVEAFYSDGWWEGAIIAEALRREIRGVPQRL